MSLEREKQLLARSDDELVRLVERLDRDNKLPRNETRRSSERFTYRVGVIPCMTFDQSGSRRQSVIYPRNISSGGISFVHRGFLHNNTEVHLVLRKLEGDPMVIKGHVRSCRHLSKMLHEVGVQFDEKLDPAQFCEPAVIEAALAASRKRNPLPKLSGRVLFVTNSGEEQRQFRTSLADTGVAIDVAGCIGAAIDAIKTARYDVVITDDELAEVPADKIFPTFRAQGHKGPVVCLTWTLTDEHIAEFAADELTSFSQRPIDPRQLAQRLSELLPKPKPAAATPDDETAEGATPGGKAA
ncbi:MAG: PilZ domain-containing protein [Phycisphaerales bacterium]